MASASNLMNRLRNYLLTSVNVYPLFWYVFSFNGEWAEMYRGSVWAMRSYEEIPLETGVEIMGKKYKSEAGNNDGEYRLTQIGYD